MEFDFRVKCLIKFHRNLNFVRTHLSSAERQSYD